MFREFAGLLKRVSAAAGVASLVAFAGQANAASYVGSWDPAFSSAFPNLGWRGQAIFVIPDECLESAGFYTNASTCAKDNGGLYITDGLVEFYEVGQEPTSVLGEGVIDQDGVLDILKFGPASATITMEVRKSDITGDFELYGVIGAFLTTATSDIDLVKTIYGYGEATFGLGFVKDPLLPLSTGVYYAQMGWSQYRDCKKFIYFGSAVPCFGKSDLINEDGSSFLTFQRVLEVPEPGSLALLLPAIGMLAAFRRRKPAPAAA